MLKRKLAEKLSKRIKLFYDFSTIQREKKKSHIANEIIDNLQEINKKVKQLSELIKASKHAIFFTGAGISTSLGIPDYRSGQNTIIKTGPGLWNRSQEQLRQITDKRKVQNTVDLVIPSLTHMAIKTLIQQNIFKHVVSQNTDGLHLRSGIKKESLSELHGNRNLQFCVQCGKKYLRDFRAIKQQDKHFKPGQKRDHFTGRHCENCKGELHDSIIYFGQKLPKEQLLKSYNQAAHSDLCLAIGSSLTVRPSSNVPLMPLQHNSDGKLVIINIQETPLDGYAMLKINGFCDMIFQKLMDQLRVDVLPYRIQRYVTVNIQRQGGMWGVEIKGVDEEHFNFSFIKNAKIVNNLLNVSIESQKITNQSEINELQRIFKFKIKENTENVLQNLQNYEIRLDFFGSLLPTLNFSLMNFIGKSSLNNLIKQQKDFRISLQQGHFKEWKIEKINN